MRKPVQARVTLALLLVLGACTGSAANTTSSDPVETTSRSPSTSTTTSADTSTTEPQTTETSEPRFCTEIGCDSLLTIELAEVDTTPEATYDIEICVNGTCATETVTIAMRHPGTGEIERGESQRTQGTLDGHMILWSRDDDIDYYLPQADYGVSASIDFTLTDSNGDVLARTDGPTHVPFERSQPNGPDCPPVCFFGRIAL